jgi:hypothetical protein
MAASIPMADTTPKQKIDFVMQKENYWYLGIRFCLSTSEGSGITKYHMDCLVDCNGKEVGGSAQHPRKAPSCSADDMYEESYFAGLGMMKFAARNTVPRFEKFKLPARFVHVFDNLRVSTVLCRNLYVKRLCLFYDVDAHLHPSSDNHTLLEVASRDTDELKLHGTGDFTCGPFNFYVYTWTTSKANTKSDKAFDLPKPKPAVVIKPDRVPAVKAGYLTANSVRVARALVQGRETTIERMARTHRLHKLHFRVSVDHAM